MGQSPERLTPENIAVGMNVAIRNARRLYSDARLLLRSGRTSSAIALTVLAIEESGKVPILLKMGMTEDDAGLVDLWRRMRDHRAKNLSWILPLLAAKGVLSGGARAEHFNAMWEDGPHAVAAELIKQRATYTEWRDRSWHFPDADNHPTFAAEFVEMARAAITLWQETTPERVRRHCELVGPKDREAEGIVEAARQRVITVAMSRGVRIRRPQGLSCAGEGWPRDFHAEFHRIMAPAVETATQLIDEGLVAYFTNDVGSDPTALAIFAAFLRREPADLESHLSSYESPDGLADPIP